MLYLYWLFFSGSAAAIIYQDLRTRLISLWLIVVFGASAIGLYLTTHTFYELGENAVFCLCYFLFSYFILILFYYLRTKTLINLLDSKVGAGDVLLLFITGCCLSPENMIVFFTSAFIISLVLHVLFFKRQEPIALGAFLLICYSVQVIYSTCTSL